MNGAPVSRIALERVTPTFDPYLPREIRPLDLWRIGDWTMKIYGIAFEVMPGERLIAAARGIAERCLGRAAGQNHYGVGFVGIHAGKTANFVFVDWWADENELHHHVFVSPLQAPEALEERTGSGLCGCVWDLQIMTHEREAWVEHVLVRADEPDLGGYLGRVLEVCSPSRVGQAVP